MSWLHGFGYEPSKGNSTLNNNIMKNTIITLASITTLSLTSYSQTYTDFSTATAGPTSVTGGNLFGLNVDLNGSSGGNALILSPTAVALQSNASSPGLAHSVSISGLVNDIYIQIDNLYDNTLTFANSFSVVSSSKVSISGNSISGTLDNDGAAVLLFSGAQSSQSWTSTMPFSGDYVSYRIGSTSVVPEPSSTALLGLGGLALLLRRKK